MLGSDICCSVPVADESQLALVLIAIRTFQAYYKPLAFGLGSQGLIGNWRNVIAGVIQMQLHKNVYLHLLAIQEFGKEFPCFYIFTTLYSRKFQMPVTTEFRNERDLESHNC